MFVYFCRYLANAYFSCPLLPKDYRSATTDFMLNQNYGYIHICYQFDENWLPIPALSLYTLAFWSLVEYCNGFRLFHIF